MECRTRSLKHAGVRTCRSRGAIHAQRCGLTGKALGAAAAQVAAGRPVDEVVVDEYITGRRRAQAGFIEPSFPTIAGSGANGAIIHYRAQPGSCAPVTAAQLMLVDSGVPPQP